MRTCVLAFLLSVSPIAGVCVETFLVEIPDREPIETFVLKKLKTFNSPEAAWTGLMKAWSSRGLDELDGILGPNAVDSIFVTEPFLFEDRNRAANRMGAQKLTVKYLSKQQDRAELDLDGKCYCTVVKKGNAWVFEMALFIESLTEFRRREKEWAERARWIESVPRKKAERRIELETLFLLTNEWVLNKKTRYSFIFLPPLSPPEFSVKSLDPLNTGDPKDENPLFNRYIYVPGAGKTGTQSIIWFSARKIRLAPGEEPTRDVLYNSGTLLLGCDEERFRQELRKTLANLNLSLDMPAPPPDEFLEPEGIKKMRTALDDLDAKEEKKCETAMAVLRQAGEHARNMLKLGLKEKSARISLAAEDLLRELDNERERPRWIKLVRIELGEDQK